MPCVEMARGKSLGLKRWRLLGAFVQGLPISYPFCGSFSFPLPYHILHLTLPPCVQTSHVPKAPFHSICRYSLFFSLKPTHFDSHFSTSSHRDHRTRSETLLHILDTLMFHQQPCEQNFNHTNGHRMASKHRSIDFKENLWFSCQHFLW